MVKKNDENVSESSKAVAGPTAAKWKYNVTEVHSDSAFTSMPTVS